MVRYISCLAVALIAGAPLWAGEVDAEFRGKAPPAPAAVRDLVRPLNAAPAPLPLPASDARADAVKGSELDNEAPAQSWRGGWGRGWGGGRGGWGWRGGWGRGGRGGWGRGWGGGWGGWGWGGGWPVGWGGWDWGGYCW